MSVAREEILFHRHECTLVVDAMRSLRGLADGEGWINFAPVLSEDEESLVPVRSGLGAWFSGRGPAVPMGTWMPQVAGDRPRSAQVGLEHGTGPDALARLGDLGIGLPEGWLKRQDHAKHGIVADLPSNVDDAVVIEWLITAAIALRTIVKPGDRWTAMVHRPG